MYINGTLFKKKTLALILLIAGGTLSVQVTWVKDHVIPILANHPHWASIGTGLLTILALLHNPVFLQAAGQILEVPPDSTVKQVTTITTPPVGK